MQEGATAQACLHACERTGRHHLGGRRAAARRQGDAGDAAVYGGCEHCGTRGWGRCAQSVDASGVGCRPSHAKGLHVVFTMGADRSVAMSENPPAS
eukprot:366214-Chlamydomonas_euryale.AAC.3